MPDAGFVYFSTPFLQTIKDSQVINWLEVLSQSGVDFDLAVLTPLRYRFKHNKSRREKIGKCRAVLKGKVTQIPILRMNFSDPFSTLAVFVYVLSVALAAKIRGKIMVFQTRTAIIHKPLVWLKRRFTHVRLVFECRGAIAEEYLNSLNYHAIAEVEDKAVRARYQSYIDQLTDICRHADSVLCVSEKLRDYLADTVMRGRDDKNKYLVIPGAADESHFYFDESERLRLRDELGYSAKNTVIVYTGRLNMHWHKGDDIFAIMSTLIAQNRDVVLLCLTPDLAIAAKLAGDHRLPEANVHCEFVNYDRINGYLSAADFAIILRDDIATNWVASPTKVAEYLLNGLPVLISKNVGDYSEFIARNDLGMVLSGENRTITAEIASALRRAFPRERIAEIGRRHYSKQSQVRKIIATYEKITAEARPGRVEA
jgi:glycosyltransferase involved in cell wall biosynthesis